MFQSGERLGGRYRIESLIASGGTGWVYRARDEWLRRRVAVKWFPEATPAVREEAEAAARLSHPNIVRLYDFVMSEDMAYLVTEYVEGQTLAEALDKRQRLPLQESLSIALELTHALGYAHQRGVVHRDVNPNNVMLTLGGQVQLMDFGMALRSGIPIQGTTAFGSIDYMAPERLAGLPGDSRCDQYSLGVLLYQMLTGRLPFSSTSSLAAIYRALHQPPPPLRSIDSVLPELLDELVRRLLAKDPAERFREMAEVCLHLEQIRRSHPPETEFILPPLDDFVPLKQLQREIERMSNSGQGGMWLLIGGLRTERRAIAEHLRHTMPEKGMRVLHAETQSEATDYPYYLFRQLFSTAWDDLTLERASQQLAPTLSDPELLPLLLHLMGFSLEEQGAFEFLEMEKDRFRAGMRRAFQQWLMACSEEQPMLLLFNGLDWIDADSLELLIDLFELLDACPIVLVGMAESEQSVRAIREVAERSYPEVFRMLDIHRVLRRGEAVPVVHYHFVRHAVPEVSEQFEFSAPEWEFYENDGRIEITDSGALILTAPRGPNACTFPFVRSARCPFPEGDFVVRFEMQYLDALQNGAGLEICSGHPENHADRPTDYQRIARIWQDRSCGRHLICQIGDSVELFLAKAPDLQAHTYEISFFPGDADADYNIRFSMDGKLLIIRQHYPYRPETLWIGQFLPARTQFGWSHLRVNWLEVVPLHDRNPIHWP